MDAIGTGLGALAEIIKLVATKDDKARAEVRACLELAVMANPMGDPDAILSTAGRFLTYVYDEGEKRAKLFAD